MTPDVRPQSRSDPAGILQQSQARLRKLDVTQPRAMAAVQARTGRKRGLSAELPDNHAEGQWAVIAREQAPRDRDPDALFSAGKMGSCPCSKSAKS